MFFNEVSIRCFLTLTKTLNFTETANILHLTQQAVSKHIAKMEENIGFKLFNRSYHSVTLTPAGENFYQFFCKMEKDYREVIEITRNYYNTLNKAISIGYVHGLDITDHMHAAIVTFSDIYHGITFNGEQHYPLELIDRLLTNKLDLIVIHKEFIGHVPDINYKVILEGPMMLVISANSPLATADPSLHRFRNEPFIFGNIHGESVFETKNKVQNKCAEYGFFPKNIIILPNLESAYIAVEMGQGISFCGAFNRMIKNPAIQKYPLSTITYEVVCAWKKNTENRSVPLFAEHLNIMYKSFSLTTDFRET